MYLSIDNKSKLELFVAILQLLKNWSSYLNMNFEKDRLYIQSMDKSHVCLADIEIKQQWFTTYDCSLNNTVSVDSNHFAILMNFALKHNKIILKYDDEISPDKLYIDFVNEKDKNGAFDHFFELNLIDVEESGLSIPKVDYDVEFSIESKKLIEVFSELNIFGEHLNIKCNEHIMEFNSIGDSTKLKVNIPIDDLNEYSISEGEELNMSFSLSHICKMCCSTKLGNIIDVSLSGEYPMSLKYNLGDDSTVVFYIAPKIVD